MEKSLKMYLVLIIMTLILILIGPLISNKKYVHNSKELNEIVLSMKKEYPNLNEKEVEYIKTSYVNLEKERLAQNQKFLAIDFEYIVIYSFLIFLILIDILIRIIRRKKLYGDWYWYKDF